MATITIPKSFFVKERRMYSNWQFAFWRELFQNSTDAGASRIWVDLVKLDHGVIHVTFTDNGCGMSREVLENVYFKLGETTKNSSSLVGGFGRARILTCFSMKSYTIHTLDNLVQGDGGEYEIGNVDSRDGTKIQIEIEDESLDSLKTALDQYLSQSQMYCDVVVNNERWASWLHRRQLTRQLMLDGIPFANVYVNKSGARGLLAIRVNGTMMYSIRTEAKAQVIVEVEPSLSRDVLTANRDGMHSRYRLVLDRFVNELAVDTISALKPRFQKKDATIRGRGMIFSLSKTKKEPPRKPFEDVGVTWEATPLAASRLSETGISLKPVAPVEVGVDVAAPAVAPAVAPVAAPVAPVERVKAAEVLGGCSEDVYDAAMQRRLFEPVAPAVGEKFFSGLPDIFVVDETENSDVRRIIDSYHPDSWVVSTTGEKKFNRGGRHYKLLMLWKICCKHAIDAMMAAHPEILQVSWGIGWVFSDTAEAMHKGEPGGSALLLNPVNKDGKMKFSLRDQADQKRMMALAKHEVAHTVFSYHNEEFAAMLTDIDEHFDERAVYKELRELLDSAA